MDDAQRRMLWQQQQQQHMHMYANGMMMPGYAPYYPYQGPFSPGMPVPPLYLHPAAANNSKPSRRGRGRGRGRSRSTPPAPAVPQFTRNAATMLSTSQPQTPEQFRRAQNLAFVLQAAQRRFLDAEAVVAILDMGARGELRPLLHVQKRPRSGCLFLYDRKKQPAFRQDGFVYVKRKGTLSVVREDHVTLKHDNELRVQASYVHSEEHASFHRRHYTDLKNQTDLVLVHYWDDNAACAAHEQGCLCIACTLELDGPGGRPAAQAPPASSSASSASAARATDQPPLPPTSKGGQGAMVPSPLADDVLEPLTGDESDMQVFSDLLTMHDESDADQLAHLLRVLTPADLIVTDFAPDVVAAEGGTRMLVSLARAEATGVAGGAFSRADLPEEIKVLVRFGDRASAPGQLTSSGVVRCVSPPLPSFAALPLSVVIEGATLQVSSDVPGDMIVRSGTILAQPQEAIAAARAGFSSALDPRRILSRKRARHAPSPMHAAGGRSSSSSSSQHHHDEQQHAQQPRPDPAERQDAARAAETAAAASALEEEEQDVEQLDDDELTDLSESLLERVVRVLVEMCAQESDLVGELDALDEAGFNLLHYCVAFSHERLVRMLLDHGADANRATATGDAPLHLAAEAGRPHIVQQLLAAGADPRTLDAGGLAAAALARKHGFEALAAQLEARTHSDEESRQQQQQQDAPRGRHRATSSAFSGASSTHSGSSVGRESLEDKQHAMLRKALASMSLKDRCALSLGMRDGDEQPMDTLDDGGDRDSASGMMMRDAAEGVGASESNMSKAVREAESQLTLAMAQLNERERSELQQEARVIQTNFRRWMLRRSVQATRRVATETSSVLESSASVAGDDHRQQQQQEQMDHEPSMRADALEDKAIRLQAVGKGFLARREYKQARHDVIQVQAATRCLLARKNFYAWRKQLSATLVIQRSVRDHQRRLKQKE